MLCTMIVDDNHSTCWWSSDALMKLFSIIAHWVWFDFAHIVTSLVSKLLLQHLPCLWRQFLRLKWCVFVIFAIMVVILLFWFSNAWRWWCPWCGDDSSALDCDVSRRVAYHGCMCCVVLMIAMFVVRLFGDAVARRVSHADVAFNIAMLSLQMLSCEVVVAWWLRCCCRVLLFVFFDFWICDAWPPFFVWKCLRACCRLCYCLWLDATVIWMFWGCWLYCDDFVEGFAFCVGLFEVGVRFDWCNQNRSSVL